MSPALENFIQAGGGLVLIIAGIIFYAAWLFLPFMLLSKLNEIVRRLKSIETEAEATARNTRRTPEPQSSVRLDR
jgi:hypothetical protein